ncbi:MAG: 3-deoxy-7-phosphoheptulonate synthase, Tyr-sensitive [Candidatus Westeberhardia cardiocondylae]|nr:3-deoxy-7-phosphoheptulonate synthase, Tyr-sensitive [Candidatus Westeberhardia cardiocondylae]
MKKNGENKNSFSLNKETTIITPKMLKKRFPLQELDKIFISQSRKIIKNIINKKDHRLLIVCGPCSIHEIDSAIDYAKRLKELSEKTQNKLYLVMRSYFEKPRTTVGWKGLINDPYINNSYNIEKGLHISRSLLLELTKIRIPLATEALDIITPQYLSDMFSWSAIGARTIESQIHREMASGLHMPIGFKNSTDGNIDSAINSIIVSSKKHHYLGISQNGVVCTIQTTGNPNSHIILRGGHKPNYYERNIIECENKIKQNNISTSLMIDCSHSNSEKNYKNQEIVATSILKTIKLKKYSIIGIMLESHINSGNQQINVKKDKMKYGVSITDACISWEKTEKLILKIHDEL